MKRDGHCRVDGCAKPVKARGMCSTHYNAEYMRKRRAGLIGPHVVEPVTGWSLQEFIGTI